MKNEKRRDTERAIYICVHCKTPCAHLYRRLSFSLSSIKALTCKNCNKQLDPYIEQEWLLVILDCILFREEAFRHVLFNVDGLQVTKVSMILKFVAAASIVDGFSRCMESVQNSHTEVDIKNDNGFLQITALAFVYCGGLMFRCLFLQAFLTPGEKSAGVNSKILWALLLPSCFSLVVVFVNIWESSVTVQLIGSLLINFWQWIALSTLSSDVSMPAMGLLAGVVWRLLTISLASMPCNLSEVRGLEQSMRCFL